MRNIWKGLLIFAAAIILCGAPDMDAQAKVKVKKVKVKSNYGKTVHVAVGKKVKLTTTVTVTPNKSKNKKVIYKTSKKKIATVSGAGNVKGVKAGSCKITVTSKKNKKKKAKISVKVVKPIKTVNLDKESLTLYVGGSQKLKASITPASGSYKGMKWTTSNKGVVTVSSDGTVKAVAVGTAKIKATSVEGSKKSASCTVKVLAANTINLSSVQVLSKDTVRFTLDKAREVTANQIVVEGKRYTAGSYTRRYHISKIRNYDNKTYDLTLDNTYSIAKDSYVRVSIATLPGNGTKSAEAQAVFVKSTTPVTKRWIGVVGDTMEETIDLSDYCYGNISYTVTGSVGGITYKATDNALIFSGEYDTATVGTILSIRAADEMGNVVIQKINVFVGNEATIVAKAEDITVLVGDTLKNIEFAWAAGGSGKYSYAAELPEGLMMNEDGTVSGTAEKTGAYDVTVTVTDKENAERVFKASATLRIMEKRTVSGKVTDASGKAVADAVITCENVNDGTIFTAKTDISGNYVVYVAEGSYHIQAVFEGQEDYVYNISVGTAGRQLDFLLRK
ncbi:MAG: Ig-like domain-containing protein [Lachnospiraceae bacterium]|nr:Ig-like domain-containing protein [Lachnospiraceae bacterium]